MTTATDVTVIADAWVFEPIVEDPPGSNHTRLGVEYGMDRVAWCAITVSLLLEHAFGRVIYRSAAVSYWIDAARHGVGGLVLLPPDSNLQPGDLVAYDFGPAYGHPRGNPNYFHISECRNPAMQSKFQTNGGNEADAMRQQWRDRRYVQAIIRPPYSGSSLPPVPQPPPEDHDMLTTATAFNPNTGEQLGFRTRDDGQVWVRNIEADDAWSPLDMRTNTNFPPVLIAVSAPSAYFRPAENVLIVTVTGGDGQTWRCGAHPTDPNDLQSKRVWDRWYSLGGSK